MSMKQKHYTNCYLHFCPLHIIKKVQKIKGKRQFALADTLGNTDIRTNFLGSGQPPSSAAATINRVSKLVKRK